MHDFTPVSALVGGALIGLSAALLLLLNGRLAGISGIVSGLLPPVRGDMAWRLAFAVGLMLGPLLYAAARGAAPSIHLEASLPVLIVAGLLVGYGTNLGSGCTSGHGVCGLSRLSLRSLAATLVFMLSAGLTVFVVHHLLVRGGA